MNSLTYIFHILQIDFNKNSYDQLHADCIYNEQNQSIRLLLQMMSSDIYYYHLLPLLVYEEGIQYNTHILPPSISLNYVLINELFHFCTVYPPTLTYILLIHSVTCNEGKTIVDKSIRMTIVYQCPPILIKSSPCDCR